MITNYRMIGKLKMQNDRVSEMTSSDQKKYMVRQYCAEDASFQYTLKGDDSPHCGRIVLMNLDTVNKQIRFTSGPEIEDGICEEKLIFVNYAPADPNIYATHTSYKSILGFALLEYIQSNRKKIRWSEPEGVDKCINYLKQIRDDFFLDDDYGIRPDYSLLSPEQATGFPDPDIDQTLMDISDAKAFKKARDKALKKYFAEQLADITSQRQAYALTIDGKYMHEIQEIADCYLDVLFYHIIDKQFAESKNKGHCHLCSISAKLSERVSLKQKFYGAQNPYYFDGASASMSKSAFSMCKDCYNEVTVGTRYASIYFKTYILGLNCLVFPDLGIMQNDDTELINPASLQSIPRLLRRRGKAEYQNSLNTVKHLQARLSGFSLFFYNKPSPTSQEFIINQLIKGISLPSLVQKIEDLDQISLTHDLPELFNSDYGLSFEGLRFLLLASQESHPNLKPIDYQRINRDILGLLSAYLYSQDIDYNLLIKRFIDVHSRKRNHVGDHSTFVLDLSAYIMMLYLKHLINFKQLRGLKSQEEQNMTTTLEKASLLDYFSNNSEVYRNNYLAQGLFIMGVYISEIERKQREKGIKRTAISKLNLRGIPVQKVKSVMAVIDDLREVWDVYNDPITDAYYRECMNSLVSSSFSPEETVFHILSGRAYNSYVGLMEYRKQQAKKDSQEAQND
ncbi:MAG: TM1802 family CRISPR-associated protein [Candidatus Cloacimonadaceae bacterium]|jgi:CRISPR-associated protein Csh1|nr:hypothetical protein [Candidatus Cloacimonadota bacterium]MDY0126890.1 TM1802 family CRISPR-associated protein [Candidatus Cloacimonadaceae bacterium]MCB5254482.1 hypothetical protein [Candidatus Cloacimonadota bacterium]MCK9178845.1 hypothetical protein [Candidatus Cloacimonadota bacterium]MCK9243097.1 hypothetical protein [Candidatus Cloacimonadota bacterium]